MRKLVVRGRSQNHSQKKLWDMVAEVEKYPTWIKYCKTIKVTEVKVGESFHDITTILWIPIEIEHVITKIKPHQEIHYFLPLPLGGKMWHKFFFSQEDDYGVISAEVTFDLCNRFYNMTVGHILEKRWEKLLRQSLSGLDEIKRLQ